MLLLPLIFAPSQNTAVVFFRRFYLHNSLFAHDPRVLLVACLLLAGKTEEEFVSPRQLVRHIHPTLTDEKLQAAEEDLLQVRVAVVCQSVCIYSTLNIYPYFTVDTLFSLLNFCYLCITYIRLHIPQGLGYELQVYHPHSCLHALLTDIKSKVSRATDDSGDGSGSSIRQWSLRAEPFLDKLLVSMNVLSRSEWMRE